MKIYAKNKKALFDYAILEKYEAGLVLLGLEVKAIKAGKASLNGSFVILKDEQVWLLNASISPYQPNNTPSDYDPQRTRQLLLRQAEVKKLTGRIQAKGLTLVPLSIYNKADRLKLEFALAKGKKKFDKREHIKKREADREIRREVKEKL